MSARILPKVFLKIALSSIKLKNKSNEERMMIKKEWADSILEILGFRLEVKGSPPPERAQILIGNHISYLDIPVILSAFPSAIFVSKDDLMRWPIIGAGAENADTIFVSRKAGENRTNARQMIESALLAKNAKVVVFPAGTSTLYETIAWKKGIFEIAKKTRMPIQLFKIQYHPLRESAYIDEDRLLSQISGLSRFKNKSSTLTWLDRYDEVGDPVIFAETLQKQLVKYE